MPSNARLLAAKRRTRKKKQPELQIPVRNTARLTGTTTVDFSFLVDWLGLELANRFAEAIRRFSNGYSASATTYSVRKVLRYWHARCVAGDLLAPAPNLPTAELVRTITALRNALFESEEAAGRAISTSANKWHAFLRLTSQLARVRAIPYVSLDDPRIGNIPSKLLVFDRDRAAALKHAPANVPRTYRPDRNSYNEGLLEPLSIVASDATYLDEYEIRLESAIETIRACALQEFNKFCAQQGEGKKLVAATDHDALLQKYRGKQTAHNPGRYVDPVTGRHFFDEAGGHPNLLGNLLSVVHHEMKGIPEPYDRTFVRGGRMTTITVQRGRVHPCVLLHSF